MRGNVIDLAVGIIIGAAFSKIVDSMVKDIVMPIINFLVGGSADFSNKFIVLSKPAGYAGPETYAELSAAGATLFAWGNFLTILLNFVLLAFVIFWMVKAVSTARARFEKEQEATAAPTAQEVVLLTEIRDLLKKQQS
ncbi:large conductance mechanosensitive channel protein MscL [Orrella daihaiensis]|uniref:Large-conductance mechanosensitive channel n=2 Tax=Orrella daihaiensis TaxID=2782176 RepID=A0ABY4AMK7_9BURK|nr:large conductance mechanosensitive channel protein MscL [Orrella daihaiensis]